MRILRGPRCLSAMLCAGRSRQLRRTFLEHNRIAIDRRASFANRVRETTCADMVCMVLLEWATAHRAQRVQRRARRLPNEQREVICGSCTRHRVSARPRWHVDYEDSRARSCVGADASAAYDSQHPAGSSCAEGRAPKVRSESRKLDSSWSGRRDRVPDHRSGQQLLALSSDPGAVTR